MYIQYTISFFTLSISSIILLFSIVIISTQPNSPVSLIPKRAILFHFQYICISLSMFSLTHFQYFSISLFLFISFCVSILLCPSFYLALFSYCSQQALKLTICSSTRSTTTRSGKSSWTNCSPSCRSAGPRSTVCPSWRSRCWTCTSCTTWSWPGAVSLRSSTRSSGRKDANYSIVLISLAA